MKRSSKLLHSFGMTPSMTSSKKSTVISSQTGGNGSIHHHHHGGVQSHQQQQQQLQQHHNVVANNNGHHRKPKSSVFHHHQQQQQQQAQTHQHHHHHHNHHHQMPGSFILTGINAGGSIDLNSSNASNSAAGQQQTTQPLPATNGLKQQQLAERAKLVNEYLKHIFDAATLIIPQFLYLGGHASVKNADSLSKMGITHVLNMAQELKLDPRRLAEKNIKLMHIAAKDAKTYNIRSDFDSAFKFIDDALINKGKIVINCARGISRSATIVIAYLMFRYKMSLLDAFSLIVRLRPQVRPNSNFRRQLQIYEQELILHHQQFQQQQQPPPQQQQQQPPKYTLTTKKF